MCQNYLSQSQNGLAKVTPKYGCSLRSKVKNRSGSSIKVDILKICAAWECRNVIQDRPKMISILKSWLKNGNCDIICYDKLYDRQSKAAADDVQVMFDNENVKQPRFLWITFDKINKWFGHIKVFFVEKIFACLATKDVDVQGEPFSFSNQLYHILDIDESQVSMDGTFKTTGGRPTTKLTSTPST